MSDMDTLDMDTLDGSPSRGAGMTGSVRVQRVARGVVKATLGIGQPGAQRAYRVAQGRHPWRETVARSTMA